VRARPLRLVLTVVAGVVILLCLGGVGLGVTLYDDATTIEHEDPDVVVSSYLRAFLLEKNDVRTESLECGNDSGLQPIRDFRADVEQRERSFNVTIMISWGPLKVTQDGANRLVETDITRSVANAQQAVQAWQFSVVDEGGWRICGARPLT
jgi:hypothetical protein